MEGRRGLSLGPLPWAWMRRISKESLKEKSSSPYFVFSSPWASLASTPVIENQKGQEVTNLKSMVK